MDKIEVKYQGFTIIYGWDDQWEVQDKGEFGTFKSISLSVCKEWIDKKLKPKREKSDFKKVLAVTSRHQGYPLVTVTSKAEPTGYRSEDDYWVTYADKKREKLAKYSLRQYDETVHKKLLELVKQKESIIEAIESEYVKLKEFNP